MLRTVFFALLLSLSALCVVQAEAEKRSAYDRWVDDLYSIQEVYWQNRIWPRSNPGPKPVLSQVIGREVIDARARRTLNLLDELEERWNLSIDAHLLQIELDRFARNTRAPKRLEQLFAALDHDPVRLGRALALPAYVDRLATQLGLGRVNPSGAPAATKPSSQGRAGAGPAILEDWLPLELPPIAGQRASGPEEAVDASTCADDTWNTLTAEPTPRDLHSAVWTGSEMIIWGGSEGNELYNTGGAYDPATDTWRAISTQGAPAPREGQTAIWSGTEMIVWGGQDATGSFPNAGGRYDPVGDTWTPTTTTGAPEGRLRHVSVWTGTEMIIWGGEQDFGGPGDPGGARYDPATDAWSDMPIFGAPDQRPNSVAVWTGSEMIITGGGTDDAYDPFDLYDDLWRYSPSTNSWVQDLPPSAPARARHTAVWSGSEMLVWGGFGLEYDPGADEYVQVELDDGWRFDPAGGSWSPMGSSGALPEARRNHTAVWTGTSMIIYGGSFGFEGGEYDPDLDTWYPVPNNGQGDTLEEHTAVWSGTEMITWGGCGSRCMQSLGSRFEPSSGVWTPTYSSNPPPGRAEHTAVWTGSEMIIHGGRGGDELLTYRYDPALNTWSVATSSGITARLLYHSAVWSGTEMMVWGGLMGSSTKMDDGGRYNPTSDTWTAADQTGAPAPRYGHYAGWTGTEMIIYDGSTNDSTGGLYDPVTDSWRPMTTVGAPSSRSKGTGIVGGSEFIVWGGGAGNDGGRYDWTADAWSPVSTTGAPSARGSHSAVWTGSEMIVWGGVLGSTALNDGGRYDPTSDSWTPTSSLDAPSPRNSHVAVWTGAEMLVWGGRQGSSYSYPQMGGRYDPSTDSWMPTTLDQVPSGRYEHTGVWSGDELLIFGGGKGSNPISLETIGGRYCAASCTTTDWFRDSDNDGVGDSSDTVSACTAPDGYVGVGGDCNDGDSDVWSTPSETRDMMLTHDKPSATTTINWSAPSDPGASSVTYDLLRSQTAADFTGPGVCLESDDVDLAATDSETPASGTSFYYLSRATNACPQGDGDLGTDSQSTPRSGATCP